MILGTFLPYIMMLIAAATQALGGVSAKSRRQALPLALIQGGSLAINDKTVNNCTSANCTQPSNGDSLIDPFSKNLFNGTLNHGPYQSMINQINSSVPLSNGTITVANKTASTANEMQGVKAKETLSPSNTISIINGTSILEKIQNGTVTIKPSTAAKASRRKIITALPSDHTDVYFRVKGNKLSDEHGNDVQKVKKKQHGDLIDPIGQLSGPNGNGPQKKKVNDLRKGSMHPGNLSTKKRKRTKDENIRKKRLTYEYDSRMDGNNNGDYTALNFLMNNDYSGYRLRSNNRNMYAQRLEENERPNYGKLNSRSTMYNVPEYDEEREFSSPHRLSPAEFADPVPQRRNFVSSDEAKLAERIQGVGDNLNLVEKLQSLTPDLNFYQNNEKKNVVFDDLLQQQNRDIDAMAKLMPSGTSMSYDRNQETGGSRDIGSFQYPYSEDNRSLEPNELNEQNDESEINSQYNPRQLESVIDQQTKAINDLYKMLQQQQQQQQQQQREQHEQFIQEEEEQQRGRLPSHIQQTQRSFYGLPEDGIVDSPNGDPAEPDGEPSMAEQENELENRSPERFDMSSQLVNSMRKRLENEQQQNGYSREFDKSGMNERHTDDSYARNNHAPDPQDLWNRELLSKLVSMFKQSSSSSPKMQNNIPRQPYVPLMDPLVSGQNYLPKTGAEGRSLLPQQPGVYVQSNPGIQSGSVNDILTTFLKSQQQNQRNAAENFLQSNFPQPAMLLPQQFGLENAQGVAMLMVKSAPDNRDAQEEEGKKTEKKERVEYKDISGEENQKTGNTNKMDEDRDFSQTLKRAADYVLENAIKDGNITLSQRTEIEKKLGRLLDTQFQNKTKGEVRAQTRAEIPRAFKGPCVDQMKDCSAFRSGGVCPFMKAFMRGNCRKTCDDCSSMDTSIDFEDAQMNEILKSSRTIDLPGQVKSKTPSKPVSKSKPEKKVPNDPVMYLTFESANEKGVTKDTSGKNNNAKLSKGATVSQRVLGTCGKVGELNEGGITWNGTKFTRKPESAISISMWVKVKKSGVINWFANGKKGVKRFYTKTKGAVVPPKVWTHVAGTYDTTNGLARIYVNGEIEEEQQQKKGGKLEKNWLVNGVGSSFGDDSLRYVDELLIYDRALSASEVRTLFNRCVFNRMVLHYGFQKGNTSNLVDQSGLHNDAKLIGGAVLKEDCGKCGACLDLTDGPEPTLELKPLFSRNLPRTKISIAVWVNLNNTQKVHNIFTAESSERNIAYRLQIYEGRIRWAIGTDKIPQIFDKMTTGVVVPEGLWTHVIASYNNQNGVGKIYANAILKQEFVVPEKYRVELSTDWDNDASIGDGTFRGFMDEFLMYNWQFDDSEAIYVRDYCADKPKLVRFTVRVPLTKKTIVPKGPSQNWWNSYTKLANKKKEKVKKETIAKLKEMVLDSEKGVTLLKHRK